MNTRIWITPTCHTGLDRVEHLDSPLTKTQTSGGLHTPDRPDRVVSFPTPNSMAAGAGGSLPRADPLIYFDFETIQSEQHKTPDVNGPTFVTASGRSRKGH